VGRSRQSRLSVRAALRRGPFPDMLNLSIVLHSETSAETMPFVKGQSGNPAGRPRKHIADLSREARRYAHLALGTLVKICKEGMERNRLAAARELLDRGFGKSLQQIDLLTLGKRLSEMSPEELANLQSRLMTDPADDAEPAQGEMFH